MIKNDKAVHWFVPNIVKEQKNNQAETWFNHYIFKEQILTKK